MKKEMLINVSQPEECRIAIIEDGILEELYVERASQDNYVGNIYKGKIVNLEPSIQAAFVDFGVGRNGFLHISDVEPQYFRQGGYDPAEVMADNEQSDDGNGNGRGKGRPQRRYRNTGRPRIKPPIQELFRRGDEIVVLSTYPGYSTNEFWVTTSAQLQGRGRVLHSTRCPQR